ncbi:unannotated protein [freshwater metagenome]|uniref:Unannotated protein n=1 Tax=freshwater metagenome TaxID=449393 RepID=A0A6J7TLB7_9ZZZZ|nr:1-acyl-sn-glycerol-3-phosphate acyltransferase [Actinomycetota bacterium]
MAVRVKVGPYYRFAALIVRPVLFAITKRDWRGFENVPHKGGVIVAVNHISHADPLVFAHYLFDQGRPGRFLAKSSLFSVPFVSLILRGAGQIPVFRESEGAHVAYKAAVEAVNSGELLGVYPEATLTRDPNHWPMTAKTGLARIALETGAPVIPMAQWGAQEIIGTYEKRIKIFPRTLVHVHAGPALDLSPWMGKPIDQQVLLEVTNFVMDEITRMLEDIRGEKAPAERFDSRKSGLPRTGNFKRKP